MIQGCYRTLLLLAACLAGSHAQAAPQAPLSPAAGPQASAAATHPHQAALDLLAGKLKKGAYRGVVALLEVDGELVLDVAMGKRDPKDEAPMTTDTIFRIYSMTKAVTAAAVLMLVDDGKVDLDEPASKYLPALKDVRVAKGGGNGRSGEVETVACQQEMTVRDLMRHSSGLTYGFMGSSAVDRLVQRAGILSPSNTNAAMLTKLAQIPLKHQPGTRFEYSVSSDVLGRLIEVASGKPLGEFFDERIFAPLGMIDTGFSVPKEDQPRVATCYRRARGGLVPTRPGEALDPRRPGALQSGGGGLYSTAADYLAFCRMLLHGGATLPQPQTEPTRLLTQASVDAMLSDQLGGIPAPMLMATGGAFGFGLSVNTTKRRKGPNTGTVGWGGLAGTGFWIDRQAQTIGVFMIQNMNDVLQSNAFQTAAYKGLGR